MKSLAILTVTALLVVSAPALAEGITFGSDECRSNTGSHCGMFFETKKVEDFLFKGQTVAGLDDLNENIDLEPGMDIRAKTLLRTLGKNGALTKGASSEK